jgi:hypothetical protein
MRAQKLKIAAGLIFTGYSFLIVTLPNVASPHRPRLFPFHSLRVEDELNDAEDDHGDADSPGVDSGLERPLLGVINENDKEDEKNQLKNSLRSDLQMEIPPQFAQP